MTHCKKANNNYNKCRLRTCQSHNYGHSTIQRPGGFLPNFVILTYHGNSVLRMKCKQYQYITISIVLSVWSILNIVLWVMNSQNYESKFHLVLYTWTP